MSLPCLQFSHKNHSILCKTKHFHDKQILILFNVYTTYLNMSPINYLKNEVRSFINKLGRDIYAINYDITLID